MLREGKEAMKVHHIGYLVKNMDKAIAAFHTLGYQEYSYVGENVVYDEYRKCDICFLKRDGEDASAVELVAPKGPESPVFNLLKKYKNTPYHICYECDNLEEEMGRLETEGWMLFQEPLTAPAIAGRRVAFLISAAAGIIELVEN